MNFVFLLFFCLLSLRGGLAIHKVRISAFIFIFTVFVFHFLYSQWKHYVPCEEFSIHFFIDELVLRHIFPLSRVWFLQNNHISAVSSVIYSLFYENPNLSALRIEVFINFFFFFVLIEKCANLLARSFSAEKLLFNWNPWFLFH